MRSDATSRDETRAPDEFERVALARFRAGQRREAFQELLNPQLGALQALARRVTGDPHAADDLVQETLVRAFRGLAAFRGDSTVRAWVMRILVRLSSEPGRWRRARPLECLEFEIPDVLGPDPSDGVIERELRERLDEALERLTVRQRAAFHLRAVEGLDYRAIGDALDCTADAARMLVLGARRKVIARLGRHLEP
jgi:RNA polymerase sigma-70 factor (ECF subfamily)